MSLSITRKGETFEVMDDPFTRAWNFWENEFATGRWEPWLFEQIDSLEPHSNFVDVGAWVGPATIWAERRRLEVVAVEPDPLAFAVLAVNAWGADLVKGAVLGSLDDRTRVLDAKDGLGNSTTRVGEPMSRQPGRVVASALGLPDVLPASMGAGDLLKIDTEGSEADILFANAELLHDVGCKILVSLHLPWLVPHERDRLWEAINTFNVETLDDIGNGFPTLLLT